MELKNEPAQIDAQTIVDNQHAVAESAANTPPAATLNEVPMLPITPEPVISVQPTPAAPGNDSDDSPSFAKLNLAEPILRAVTEAGYKTPTPIQAQAIPVVMAGTDVMGGAQTGTGKTAAFALPILNRLFRHANTSPSPARHPVRALILAPTRELAIQIAESVELYSKYTNLRSTVVFGGVDIKEQRMAVRAGVEVLVATPGRLLDHIEQKNLSLNHVEVLVLDEADRMLDMGFIPDINRIIALLPDNRQSLLFSATFSNEIKALADRMLKKPTLIEVARRNTAAETVTQQIYRVQSDDKRRLLGHLVASQNLTQVLVFSRSKLDTARLARALERDGFTTGAIHGDKTQEERIKALDAFKRGDIRILVATDVAARGIDIDQLPTVVNYELPFVAEDYVHRIGRTGRAGASGTAISFVSQEDGKLLAEIEKLIKRKIDEQPLPDLTGYGDRFAPRSERHSSSGTNADRRERSNDARPSASRSRDKSHYDLNPDQPISPARRPIVGHRGRPVREVCVLLKMPVKLNKPAAKVNPIQDEHVANVEADNGTSALAAGPSASAPPSTTTSV